MKDSNKRYRYKGPPQANNPIKDIFDVKENLKKLRSGTDNYSTKSEAFQNEKLNNQNLSSEASSNQMTGNSSYYSDKVDVLRDRIDTDISIIRQNLDNHKEKTNQRFDDGLSELRKEITAQSERYETKISTLLSKEWFKYIIGALVGVTILIAGIIYSLSYQNVILDINDLKRDQNRIEKVIEKISEKNINQKEIDSMKISKKR